ncbi:MAG: NADH-quinone oxidoreductase subunit L, partial [Bdellovibrionota bacterium]
IIGMPPFAGFFSKDEILWYTWASPFGSKLLWFIGLLGAVTTAFYMTRLMALTFWGPSRVPSSVHPHESPPTMTIPLIVLGILSVVGGWIGIPHVIGAILPGHPGNMLEHWLEPLITKVDLGHPSAVVEWSLMGISVAAAGLSAVLAYDFYIRRPKKPAEVVKAIQPIYDAAYNKYYVDEAYFAGVINPLIDASKALWMQVDVNFIDKTTYWLSDLVKSAGGGIRQIQNGNMQQYALYIALGIVGTIFFMFLG